MIKVSMKVGYSRFHSSNFFFLSFFSFYFKMNICQPHKAICLWNEQILSWENGILESPPGLIITMMTVECGLRSIKSHPTWTFLDIQSKMVRWMDGMALLIVHFIVLD